MQQDKDGIIWPADTYKGFRDIGYNPYISFLAPFFIHGGMSIPTQPRWAVSCHNKPGKQPCWISACIVRGSCDFVWVGKRGPSVHRA